MTFVTIDPFGVILNAYKNCNSKFKKDMLHIVAVVHNIVQALLDIMFMTYLICY